MNLLRIRNDVSCPLSLVYKKAETIVDVLISDFGTSNLIKKDE
jgi:hypothetical protein